MIRLPPRSTRTDTRCHYTTLFLSPDRRPPQPASGVPSRVALEPKRAERQPAAADPPLHPDPADRRAPPVRRSHRQASCLRPSPVACVRRWTISTCAPRPPQVQDRAGTGRSEEHTSELQSLMRISYAVFCLKKKNNNDITT